MTQSEESITRVTSYRFPPHSNAGKTVRMICAGARLFPK